MSITRWTEIETQLRWRTIAARTAWQTLAALIRSEIANGRKELPWRHRMRAYMNGMTTETYVLYDLQRRDPDAIRAYVNDFERIIKPGRINGWFKHVLQDKLVFAASLAFFGFDKVPTIFGTVFRGNIVWRDPSIDGGSLSELLSQEHRLILKPIRGEGGGGVILLQQDSDNINLNGQRLSRSELDGRVARLDGYLIQKAVEQARYSAQIFPSSVNTIRIVTMRDIHNGHPFIAAAVHSRPCKSPRTRMNPSDSG